MLDFRRQPSQARSHYDPKSGYAIVDVQDTDEGPAPGTAIKPIPEVYEGQNFPYRGTETHGVDPLYDVEPPAEQWEGGTVEVRDSDDEDKPEKVTPVRIVSESTREHETWSVQQLPIDGRAQRIVGRDTRRTALKIKNLSDIVVIYVAPNEQTAKVTLGFPVDPGGDFSISGSDEVWAISATGAQVLAAILIEYTAGG